MYTNRYIHVQQYDTLSVITKLNMILGYAYGGQSLFFVNDAMLLGWVEIKTKKDIKACIFLYFDF